MGRILHVTGMDIPRTDEDCNRLQPVVSEPEASTVVLQVDEVLVPRSCASFKWVDRSIKHFESQVKLVGCLSGHASVYDPGFFREVDFFNFTTVIGACKADQESQEQLYYHFHSGNY